MDITVILSERDASFAAASLRKSAETYPLGHRKIVEGVADQMDAAVRVAREAYQDRVNGEKNYVRQIARRGYLYVDPGNGLTYLVLQDVYERQMPEVAEAVKQLIGDGVLERSLEHTTNDGLLRVVPVEKDGD